MTRVSESGAAAVGGGEMPNAPTKLLVAPLRCRRAGCNLRAHTRPDAHWEGYCCGACCEGYEGWQGTGHGQNCPQVPWEEAAKGTMPSAELGEVGAADAAEAFSTPLSPAGTTASDAGTALAPPTSSGDPVVAGPAASTRVEPAANDILAPAGGDAATAAAPIADEEAMAPAGNGEPDTRLAPVVYGRAVKVAILACGSRGDIQPCVALAVCLRDAGHSVKVICNDCSDDGVSLGHEEFVRSFSSLDVDIFPGDSNDATGKRQCFILEGVKAFMPDLILYRLALAIEAWVIEEVLGIMAVEYNVGIPTSRDDAVFVMQMLQHEGKQRVDEYVRAVTLADIVDVNDVCARLWRRGRPALYACSEHFVGTDAESDWPEPTDAAAVHLTGYWFFDLHMQTRLTEAGNAWFGADQYRQLVDFMESGVPPVYIGWGSSGSFAFDNAFLGLLAVRTLRLAGRRGVILGSYGNLDSSSLEGAENAEALQVFARQNVFWMRWAPHEWLFPRCRAIVIHGGCNTMASALRAGRPMVVTPIFGDQFFWADQAAIKRVGVRTGPLESVSALELSEKLEDCESEAMVEACRDMAERLRAEDGVAKAVQVLSAYVQTGPVQKQA